jgi:MerR family redox-sensitive transcriptional activator SoxR
LSASWRPRLDEQIAMLERLRDKLTGCIGCGCLSLRLCHLVNPGDEVSERGPGPRYVLDPD